MKLQDSMACVSVTEFDNVRLLAPVVQRLDNAIKKTWIVIYPVDSVIHLSNKRGLVLRYFSGHG